MTTDQRGIALILTLTVLTLLTVLCAAAVAAVSTGITSARRADASLAAHAAAEAAADEMFAHVVEDPSYLTDTGTPSGWTTALGLPCTDVYEGACVESSVTVSQQPGNPYASSATLQVTAATLCPHGTSELASCITDTVRQRLQQRQFFDYLYFDELETLDPVLYPTPEGQAWAGAHCPQLAGERPSGCVAVPFLGPAAGGGGDVVYGPIHTNDSAFSDCLAPRFAPDVTRVGWPSTKSVTSDPTTLESSGDAVFDATCAGSSPVESSGVSEAPESPYYSFDVDVRDLASIADAPDVYSGSVSITLDGGTEPGSGAYTVSVGGDPAQRRAWPGTGVLYVDGDAYVSGEACDPISIAATGDVFVDGDLTYGADASCPDAATGLEADDSVVVLPTDGPSGPLVNGTEDRTVEAAVLALGKDSCFTQTAQPAPGVTCSVASGDSLRGGSFYVQGWNTATLAPGQRPHMLHFLGAIATVWRGAIGGYDPATGALVSGWAKDFAFDRQLRTTQPPYFLSPVDAGWARTDLGDVGTPG